MTKPSKHDWKASFNEDRGVTLLSFILGRDAFPKAVTQTERREKIWQEVQREGGVIINRRGHYNTKDPDIKWIIKNKPVKMVRTGLPRSRVTHLVAV